MTNDGWVSRADDVDLLSALCSMPLLLAPCRLLCLADG
jgi:hypothetical protein